MNKTHAAITLAKNIGQVLTPELAAAIARELFNSPDLAKPAGFFEPSQYKGYVFALESFREILAELHALHVLHYAETETYRAGIPMLVTAYMVDLLANWTIATVWFREIPRKPLELVTDRLSRYVTVGIGWRAMHARWVCTNLLDYFDPSDKHCTH